MVSAVGYLFGNENIILDESLGEEEKEEREANDGEEKDKEFDLEDQVSNTVLAIENRLQNANIDYKLQSQHYTEDTSPPPEI